MRVDHVFPAESRGRIAAAVRDAETGTSGEIVVVLTGQADEYAEAAWLGGALSGATVLALDFLYRYAAPFWLPIPREAGLLAALAVASLAFLAVRAVPSLRCHLLPAARRHARVRTAAEAAFYTTRVSATRERTGVLVFISLFEREVVVLPDIGIAAKAPESAWSAIVALVVAGMTNGRAVSGVVEAVGACGSLLRAAGFAARPDDVNEIDDGPRVA